MNVIKDFNNDLLKRREIEISFISDTNPGFEKFEKEIPEKFKVDGDCVVIQNVKSGFGRNEFIVKVLIYSDPQMKNLFEPKKKEKKAGVAK